MKREGDVVEIRPEEMTREEVVIEQTAYALFTSSPAGENTTWNKQVEDTRELWRGWARALIEELDNCGLTITDKEG